MSFQPLDPNTPIDPYTVASLTGQDARTGIYLDADQTNSSVLITTNDTPALYIDKFQNLGVNTLSPSAQLDVNSSSGSCIQLTYNNSSTNKANIRVTSDGKLALSAGGSEVSVDTTTSLNIKSHNGSNSGLMLNNQVVKATADQLNFTTSDPGVAAASKALVLSSGLNIEGINALSATQLTGTLQTASQPNVTSVNVLDVAGHNGAEGLSLGGSLVSSSAEQLNYVNTTLGMAQGSKALVLSSDRDIANIRKITASEVFGTLQTAAQPNITSLGTLQGLDINGALTGLTELSIGTTDTSRALVIKQSSGNCVRMFNGDNLYTDLLVDTAGNLLLTSQGGNVDITSHDGVKGLKLGGVLVNASAGELNYLHDVLPGSASAGKTLVVDASSNIANINRLTAQTLVGTVFTQFQPNIESVNVLNVATHDGSNQGLKLGGTLVVATAHELNYVKTTVGAAEPSKALIVDGDKNIEGINALSAEELTGTLQTAAQPNVTSVGTLTSIATSGALTMGSTVLSEEEVKVLDAVVPGTASANKALVVNDQVDVSGINKLSATELTGTLQTASQPKVTSVKTLDIGDHDGSKGLSLGGVLVTAMGNELNYVDTTPGTAEANKALVLNGSKDVSGIHALSAEELTGTLQTAAQPNVTSVGTLSSIATSGSLTMGTTVLSEDEVKVLDDVVPGTVAPSKAIVVNADKDITSFRNLSAVALSGEIQTAAQPKITSVGTLSSIETSGTLTMGSTVISSSEIAVIDAVTAGTVTDSKAVVVDANKSVTGFNSLGATSLNLSGQSPQITMGTTTIDEAEIGVIDAVSAGTVSANKAIVVDGSKNISGFGSLSATSLTGEIQTAAQPKITSVGTLTSIATSGNLTMGATTINEAEIGVIDAVAAGTVSANKAVVVDVNKDIGSFRNLTATNLTGTLQTAAQPNVTSVGTLSSITTSGNLTMGTTTISESEIKVLDAVVPGTVSAGKAIVTNTNNSIQGIASISTGGLTITSSSNNTTLTLTRGTGSPMPIPDRATIRAYSPTLNMLLVCHTHVAKVSTIGYTNNFNGWTGSTNIGGASNAFYIYGLAWSPAISKFVVFASTTNNSSNTIKIFTSTDGINWTDTNATISGVANGTSLEYHPESQHLVFFSMDRFYYSSDGLTWNVVINPVSISSGRPIQSQSTTIVNNYVFASKELPNGTTTYPLVSWSGSSWSSMPGLAFTGSQHLKAYHQGEDRLYMMSATALTASTGSMTIYTIDSISTKAPSTWVSSMQSTVYSNVVGYDNMGVYAHNAYGFVITGTKGNFDSKYLQSIRIMRIVNKSLIYDFTDGGNGGLVYGVDDGAMSAIVVNNDVLVIPAGRPTTNSSVNIPIVTGTLVTLPSGLVFGSTTITENEAAVLDAITAGTVSASKAVVVDANKNIAGFGSLSATTLTGEIQTAAQPNITSVGTLTSIATSGSLTMGSTVLSEDEIKVLDGVEPGTVTASKAVVVDANKDISAFRKLYADELSGVIQTVAQPKITSVGTLTSLDVAGDVNVGGSLNVAGTFISQSEILTLDNAVPGTATATKALITDDNNRIAGINSLSATSLTGTLSTDAASQPNLTSVLTLDVVDHNGIDKGLKLGGVLLTATANQINSIFGAGGTGTFNDLAVTHNLTLANANGIDQGLVLGSTLVTSSGTQLNYVNVATPGVAQASKALVFDDLINITSINELTANKLTGTIQTAYQPLVTSVETLNVAGHNGEQGLKLGGVLLTATATQINSIFNGGGGNGAFNDLTVNHNLTIPFADSDTMGLVLGTTLVKSTGTELNYLYGSTPGQATAGNALVLDGARDISNINFLYANELTGTLKTAAQPNVTSVGTLTSIATSGSLTMGSTVLSENEVKVLDAVELGVVAASKAVVVDINKDISSFNNLTAVNLIGTTVAGTLQTAAQPNVTSVGKLTSLAVGGDVSIDGSLVVGGTFISQAELLALDEATPGHAENLKAMITDDNNSIDSINSLTATSLVATNLTGTLQTAAQPTVTSVGTLTSLDVAGNVNVGGNLNVAGTFISKDEIIVLDNAVPGHAAPSKAMITDANNSIDSINSLTATSLTGTLQTESQPNIKSVSILDITTHDGAEVGLKLNGTLVTATASELNYVDTTAGSAQASKALVLNETKDISGINNVSLVGLTSFTGSFVSSSDSTSTSTGAIVTAGGVGIAKALNVGTDANVGGNVLITGTTTHTGSVAIDNADETTSTSTGSLTTDGGVGIAKSLQVGIDITVGGDIALTGDLSQAGITIISNETDSTTTTNGSIVTNGGVGIAKALNVGTNATVGGNLSVSGSTSQSGSASILNTTESTSTSTGSVVAAGGVGIAKNLNVGGSAKILVATDSTSSTTGALTVVGGVGVEKSLNVGADANVGGNVSITGTTTQQGNVSVASVAESTSTSTGSIVTAGGVGIAKKLQVGSDASVGGNLSIAGTSTLVGKSSVSNAEDSTTSTTGAFTVAGGVGVAKALNVGTTLAVAGDASVVGNATLGGDVSINGDVEHVGVFSNTNTTRSTSTTTGALVTAGGVGIAKELTVGGVAKISNSTPSTDANSGALVVVGGAGVFGDVNVGGNSGVGGNVSVAGNIDADGQIVSAKLSLASSAGAPFTTSMLTTIKNINTVLSLNPDAGIGYAKNDEVIVVAPLVVAKESVLYKSEDAGATWATVGLSGSALSQYNATYSGYTIHVNQLVVNPVSEKLWVAGSLYNESNSIPIVLSGSVSAGLNSIYEFGTVSITTTEMAAKQIAVATDEKVAVLVFDAVNNNTNIHYLNAAMDPNFNLNSTGDFVSLSWIQGFGKFIATRENASAIYSSTDDTCTTWENATTPSGVAPKTIAYNSTLDICVAVGSNFIWHSADGLAWTNGSYATIAYNDEFSAVLSSPNSGVFAVYSNINCTRQVYYSTDGMNWNKTNLPQTFGYDVASTSSVAYDSAHHAYAVSYYNSTFTIQKLGPFDFSSTVFDIDVTSNYVQNKTGSGYKWFNNSTPSYIGSELMQLNSSGLEVNASASITNATNSSSTSTGALVVAGGVGIAKKLYVGGDATVGGNLSITGTTSHSGLFDVANTTDSTSPSTGALTTAGGVGIAKALNVGTNATVGGNVTIVGTTTQTGSVSITSSEDSSNVATGSLTTLGGVGVAKTLNVGQNANVGGNVVITGTTSQSGVVSIVNESDSTSSSTGALVVSGGVGVAKSLRVGEDISVTGDVSITGTTSQQGDVAVSSLTESTSSSTGSIITSGGVGIAKSLNVGADANVVGNVSITGTTAQSGVVSISNSTNAVSTSTGALVVAGGVGVAKSLVVGEGVAFSSTLSVGGITTITDATNASSSTNGSFTTSGGAGIAKSLFVGDGIYGTLQTAAQPNIRSVTTLDITNHDGAQGLKLGGSLVSSSATELNYLHGSTPGAATEGNALVLNADKTISGITSLSATQLTGTLQTESQPNVKSVTTLDITAHDGSTVGLKLAGVLLKASANQLNSLVEGTSDSVFNNATVSNNLTLSGANGIDKGLILGSTLVTSSGEELNYLHIVEKGQAQPSKALVLDFSSNIAGINSLTASELYGAIKTPSQPGITSVNVLDITGHNGSFGLSLGGALVTSSAVELNYVDTTVGVAEASKALVLDANRDIANINKLTASELVGTLQTAAQPKITSVGTLTSLSVAGDVTVGSTVISETDIAKIDAITNGTASANKALVLDSNKDISGIHSVSSEVMAIGAPQHSDLPLEVGSTTYQFSGAYAYMNNQNAHGMIDAGMGVSASYSSRFDGRILVTGEVECTSDRRMKKNVTDIDLSVAKRFVKESRPIRFNWKSDDEKAEFGWLAQEVAKSNFPELVSLTPYPGMKEEVDEDGFVSPADAKFSIATGKVIPLLTMTTKDLYEQNELKDQKIQELEERLAKLEAVFSKMV